MITVWLLASPCHVLAQLTYVELVSEPFHGVAVGLRWRFDLGNSQFEVTRSTPGAVEIMRTGASFGAWTFSFGAPTRSSGLEVGVYEPVRGFPSASIPGLTMGGNGRGCTTQGDFFEVLEIEQAEDGTLEAFAVDFEHVCGGRVVGKLRYNSSIPDPTPAPARDLLVPAEYATIQDAIADASDGDRIVVGPGTYQGPIDSGGLFVRIVSERGPDATTIVGQPGDITVNLSRGGNSETGIEGFTILGGDDGLRISGGTGTPTASNNVIIGSRLGMFVTGRAVARGNVIRDCFTGARGGGVSGDGGIFENRFEDVQIGLSFNAAGQTRIEGNTVIAAVGIRSSNATLLDARNNLFITSLGIEATAPSSGGIRLLHNTVIAESSHAVELFSRNTDDLVANNIFWSRGRDQTLHCRNADYQIATLMNNFVSDSERYFSGQCDTAALSAANFFDAPGFVDPASSDYRLAAGSPNIDRGGLFDVVDDFEGDPRPLDGDGDDVALPDIGYDEADPETFGPCAGDCNGDGRVTVSELVLAVLVGLGERDVAHCQAADPDGDGTVAIDELILAVRATLDGCFNALVAREQSGSRDRS